MSEINGENLKQGNIFQLPGFSKWYIFLSLIERAGNQRIIHCYFPLKENKILIFQATIFPAGSPVIMHKLRRAHFQYLKKDCYYIVFHSEKEFSIRRVIKITKKGWCRFEEIFSTSKKERNPFRIEKPNKPIFRIPKNSLDKFLINN